MSTWYAGGLRFACTRCGGCCTGPQGYVWVSPRDHEAIAGHLGLAPEAFRKRYTRLVGTNLCLVDKPNGDCVFLTEDKRCSIQDVKPRQCLTYPFWPRITASRESWEEEATRCPGIGGGERFSPEEIDAIEDRDNPRDVLCRIFERKRGSS